MKVFSSVNEPAVAEILRNGGVGIIRTDTLYGIVGRADSETVVQRIYDLKSRDETKSPIVLIGNIGQILDEIPRTAQEIIEASWPGKVSVILPAVNAPVWLRRGNDSVAYRLPDSDSLRALVLKTSPLIAPSANPEGDPPAMTITQAQTYFGDTVDFYVDGGEVEDDTPSKLLLVKPNGQVERLR